MNGPEQVSIEFIKACYNMIHMWEVLNISSVGKKKFLENDLYLEIAKNGKLILCKDGIDPRKKVRANTYRYGNTPSALAKMLSVYLSELENEDYWE